MGLFSDVDWLIILGIGAFLLLGTDSGRTVRQLGRWYARAVRLKQELVSEVARAADLPVPTDGSSGSLRAVLLGTGVGEDARDQLRIPLVGRTGGSPLSASDHSPVRPSWPWTGGYATTWTTTVVSTAPGGPEGR